jgi:hypothetical protein
MIRKLIPRRDKSPLAKPVPEPMSDVMIDLETLGRRPGCVVLSIGAVEFGPAGLGREFYIVLDIFGQKSLGLHEDPDTLAWWEAQSIEARQVLTQARDPKLPKFGLSLDLFNEWLSPIGFKRVKVWGATVQTSTTPSSAASMARWIRHHRGTSGTTAVTGP